MFENWLEHSTLRNVTDSPEDTVKIHFSTRNDSLSIRMGLYIGVDLASKCNLQSGDRIFFLFNPENRKEFLVKNGGQEKGYKLTVSRTGKESGNFLKTICTAWIKDEELTPNDYGTKTVKHEIKDGNLLISF